MSDIVTIEKVFLFQKQNGGTYEKKKNTQTAYLRRKQMSIQSYSKIKTDQKTILDASLYSKKSTTNFGSLHQTQ